MGGADTARTVGGPLTRGRESRICQLKISHADGAIGHTNSNVQRELERLACLSMSNFIVATVGGRELKLFGVSIWRNWRT